MKLLLLSSSRGTTLQAVVDALQDGSLEMECLGLIADREDRGCVQKVKDAGYPVVIAARQKDEDREAYDKRLNDAILELGGDPSNTIIAALGWMFILSAWFVKQWEKKIINVHPSLLPKYPGGHAISDVLSSGDSETGMTIHYIDEGVDTGEIIEQKSCSIDEGETEDSLKQKIQSLEKEWYPKVLQNLK